MVSPLIYYVALTPSYSHIIIVSTMINLLLLFSVAHMYVFLGSLELDNQLVDLFLEKTDKDTFHYIQDWPNLVLSKFMNSSI